MRNLLMLLAGASFRYIINIQLFMKHMMVLPVTRLFTETLSNVCLASSISFISYLFVWIFSIFVYSGGKINLENNCDHFLTEIEDGTIGFLLS